MLELWTSFFANHASIRTAIGFFHVAGLVVSGGCAIAADRMTLIATRQGLDARIAQLKALRGTHRLVLTGLGAVIVSGLLLFAADSDTFLYSKLFWIKMGLLGLLLINGAVLVRAERQAEQGNAGGWKRLTATSIASVVLWLLTTLAGAALPNIG